MHHRKRFLIVFLAFSIIANSAAKPKITVAADGFPTGQTTPEGVASDFARAFINRDVATFRSICIRAYATGQARVEYIKYLEVVSDQLNHNKANSSPDDPTKLVRVFAARHLTKDGPASYGYASFDFQDVMFVDIEVLMQSGHGHLRRTMVIKDRDGKWYAHPVPDVSPLLSDGLFDESASVQLFSNAYDVQR
ncbi:MAG TPA: hypothetical protein VGK24_10270 [Candidatus Angelobacter sp.]|jgi:hypothetical protein